VGNIPGTGELENISQSSEQLEVGVSSEMGPDGNHVRTAIASKAILNYEECLTALNANPTWQSSQRLKVGQVLCAMSVEGRVAALKLTGHDQYMALGFDVAVWEAPR